MSGKRSFNPLPFDMDEEDRIDQYAAKQGIPDSRRAIAPAPEQATVPVALPVVKPPRIDLQKVTFELPAYAIRALKQKALDDGVSVRHIIMRGVVKEGIEIAPEDLVEDGRRRGRT